MRQLLGLEAAVVGGDLRQIAVAEALKNLFKQVRVFGHTAAEIIEPLKCSASLTEAVAGVKVIVLPISGMNDAGLIRSYQLERLINFGEVLGSLHPGTLIVTGSMTPRWLQTAERLQLQILQYADDDEIAVLNSIPTAEGAVQIAMEELPITIHGSSVLVAGFGRVGLTVARDFKALGARVLVTARRRSVLARAVEMGCETVPFESFAQKLGSVDIIINTVPSLIFNSQVLQLVAPDTLIIDLASAPGGVDFEKAKELKVKAILTPALPGKVAPKTAGAILANAIPNLICNYLGGER